MEAFIIMVVLIIIILIVLFGILFLPSVITIIKMSYYEKVEGTIVDKEVKLIETPDARGKVARYKYEFNYLNKSYQIKDKAYGYNKKLEIGSKVYIYIKKGNPEIYISPNRVRDRYIYLILSLSGIIPLLIVLKILFFK